MTGNRAEAEELAQDAFLKVWERWDRVADMEEPIGYLYRTAMNLFRKRYRRAVLALRKTVSEELRKDELSTVEDRSIVAHALIELTPPDAFSELFFPGWGFGIRTAKGTVAYRGRKKAKNRLPVRMEFHLAADSTAPLLARHRVTTAAGCAGTPTAEALALLTSELVSNAIRHGPVARTQDVVVRFCDGDSLRVEVLDGGVGFVAPAERPPGQPGGGWGLHIVDQLAAAWGVEAEGTRNKVWFELDR